ncbi:MAG: hypothetical protein MUF42_12175 [Cytophagaceae bacterium]|jgi:hypothetical protein|nr:hypothetical protein [Cytophagaceae bacterium]
MALIAKTQYNQETVDKVLEYLKLYHQNNAPIEYEIIVDGFKAVRRTSDPSLFTMFENFILPQTSSMQILLYTGSSNNNDKYIFTFSDGSAEDKSSLTLGNLDIDKRIEERLEKEKRAWEFEQLKKEYEQLLEERNGLVKEVNQINARYEDMLSRQSPLNGLLGEVGSAMLESFVRRNPKTLSSITGNTQIAGLLEQDFKEREKWSSSTGESEVSFKPKSEDTTTTYSEQEKQAMTFVGQLNTHFSKQEMDKVGLILHYLAEEKNRIDTVLDLLEG